MRISDWSSDVCSSDLPDDSHRLGVRHPAAQRRKHRRDEDIKAEGEDRAALEQRGTGPPAQRHAGDPETDRVIGGIAQEIERSEEHTSELQSLMRISYAVFCLKKKKNSNHNTTANDTV